MRRRKANVPRDQRLQILREYLTSNESAKEPEKVSIMSVNCLLCQEI